MPPGRNALTTCGGELLGSVNEVGFDIVTVCCGEGSVLGVVFPVIVD